MLHRHDLEAMLKRQGRITVPHPRDANALLVSATQAEDEPITLRLDGPLLLARLRVAAASELTPELMRRMLVLNAQMLITASFGIRGDDAVLEACHPVASLGEGELAATLAEIDLVRGEATP